MRRANTKAQATETAEWRKALRLVPEPDILTRTQAKVTQARAVHADTAKPGKVRKPIKSARRLQALLDNEHRREVARKRRARREAQQANAVDVPVLVAGPGRRMPRDGYPDCPHCGGDSIRAGVHKGEQRFRCKACNRTYYSEAALRPVDAGITLVCCRCGGGNCAFRGAAGRAGSGIMGRCHDCQKNFTQGGRHHLDTTLALLIRRLQALDVGPHVRAEVYAHAAVAVLQGVGYTWSVPLDVAGANQRLGKETWGDRGSEHPAISGVPVDTIDGFR
jgi:transposase-like protein